MTYKLGEQIAKGDRFKVEGRWHVAAGDAGPFLLYGGEPYGGLRAVPVEDPPEPWKTSVGVLTGEAYP